MSRRRHGRIKSPRRGNETIGFPFAEFFLLLELVIDTLGIDIAIKRTIISSFVKSYLKSQITDRKRADERGAGSRKVKCGCWHPFSFI